MFMYDVPVTTFPFNFVERRKNKKLRKKHRKNIDYMITNFLNEDSRKAQVNRQLCVNLLGE